VREDLTNAIALNSTMFNMATALGPAVGGVIYAAVGPAWCFTVNGVSYLAVIAALLAMRLPRSGVSSEGPGADGRRRSGLAEVIEGLRYVAARPTIIVIMGVVGLLTFFGFSFVTLLPAWAVDVLDGGPQANGALLSARGIGALASAFGIASLGRFQFRGKLLSAALFAFPVFLFGFTFTRSLATSMLFLVGIGGALIIGYNLANSLVQGLVDDRVRGRVMSIYSLTYFGLYPVGGLVVGAIAQRIGPVLTITLNAAALLVLAVAVWIAAPKLRSLR
jgi:hypothetical protein